MARIVVVGGGFAGLAAATALVDRGHQVRVIERRPFVGGKVFSFADPAGGPAVDNGQHAFLSAYRNTLALLDRWGTRQLVAFQRRLEMVFMTPEPRLHRFRAVGLPGPFHLTAALLGLTTLSVGQRLATIAPALRLLALDAEGRRELDAQSFGAWLRQHGQGAEAIRVFWEPLALAAVNGPPDAISAYMALQVLALGFLGDEATSRLGYATVPLSRLFEPVGEYLARGGGELLLGKEVREVAPGGQARWLVQLRDGTAVEADSVVLAVPPWRLARLLPEDLAGRIALGDPGSFATAPIVSIQLTLDRQVVPHDVVALLDSPVHWVFNTGRIRRDAPAGALALTTSCGRELAARSPAEVQRLAVTEIARFFPAARDAQVVACRVVKEIDATLACAPGLDRLRPPARTALPGLALAGSWLRTGLPGTMEGATMSGLAAAEALELERGQPCRLVQPLPEPGGLAALLRAATRATRRAPGRLAGEPASSSS